MKQIFITTSFLLCCSLLNKHKEALLAFNIYQASQDGGAKAPLEKITAMLQTSKGKSTSTVYEITGAKSTTRVYAVEAKFKTASDLKTLKTDPATVIQLYKLEAGKNRRLFSLTTDSKVQSSMITISFQQEDYGNYKIILTSYLIPGEYAFIDKTTAATDGSVTVFAFGID